MIRSRYLSQNAMTSILQVNQRVADYLGINSINMKLKIRLLIVFATSFFTMPTMAQRLDLTGTWEVDQKNSSLTKLIFGENNSFMMVMNRETFGGENFSYNGKAAMLTYKINYDIKPARFDLIVTESESNRKTISRGLLMIINPNVIKVALNFSDGERPVNFTVSNSAFFKRVRN